jgi:hypothetical protein
MSLGCVLGLSKSVGFAAHVLVLTLWPCALITVLVQVIMVGLAFILRLYVNHGGNK